MSLTEPTVTYKPHRYPWALDFWKRQQQIHWLPTEVPMGDDVRDFEAMGQTMKSLVTGIFRMFVQADVDVSQCYHKIYQRIFKPTEVQMMLTAFSNMETVHIAAYSHLLDTLRFPEHEYAAFLEYEEMKAKHNSFHQFDPKSPIEVAHSLAGVSGFGEGLQLFASFAMLLNFPRQNLLKGMGQIISWSVRDESLHCEGIMRLYHEWLRENPDINERQLAQLIHDTAIKTVEAEDAFIDLVHEGGEIPGARKDDYKTYNRYMADLRLRQLRQPPIFEVGRNPLPWVDAMQTAPEHANFFEAQATEYSRGATAGDWSDAFN